MSRNGKSNASRKRRKSLIRRRTAPGAPPGTIKPDPASPQPNLKLIAYGPDGFEEKSEATLSDVVRCLEKYSVTWLNVDGLGNDTVVAEVGRLFHLHPLALEDVVNTHQRAKVEEYENYLFITARMINHFERIETEQLSLFLGKNFVITFQEFPGDSFDQVRDSLRKGRTQLRQAGPDYLAYALIDAVIDAFFPALDAYGEALDYLEAEVVATPDLSTIARIHDIKNDLILLRRAIWPQREALNALLRDQNVMIQNETRLHLRDCYDHTIQIIDLVEVYRDIASGLTDLYVSSVSNRMNEVMKVLTIIATIFIPLTFVTSVYGMNFNTQVSPWNMPELDAYFGYVGVWAIMILIAGAMLYFFSRKGWLRSLVPNGHLSMQTISAREAGRHHFHREPLAEASSKGSAP